nr:hypothetical protein [Tanacetum cinerariifolium]
MRSTKDLKVAVRTLLVFRLLIITYFDSLIIPSPTELLKRPAIKASYYASLLVALNLNLRAYVNFVPFGFVIIRLAPEPSMHDDPSVKSIHGSRSSSLSSMGVSGGSSSERSTMKYARICPLTDVLGL